MKRVLLDVDGVLADFIGSVLATLKVITGEVRHPYEVDRFDFCEALSLPPVTARVVKDRISNERGWWSSLSVFPGAVEGVAALRSVADVYIVTSPWNSCHTWLHEREAWLKRWFDIPHSRVIATSAKHCVAGDVFVDDKTETLVKWDDEQGSMWQMPDGSQGRTRAVQWETPHNRRDEWHGDSTRSWSQLVGWCS